MVTMQDLFKSSVLENLTSVDLTISSVFLMMGISLLFSLYIFAVYRVSTRSGFYSLAFGKTLVGMSVVTTAIIIAMQANIVVSLGMVGALSIVRFRNAVKAPVDLLFLFWAISMGIVCGTGIVEIAIVTCIMMTIVVFGLDFIPVGKSSYILTINGDASLAEDALLDAVKTCASAVKVRTRSIYENEQEFLIELHTKKTDAVVGQCRALEGVTSVHLIFHDGEVRF